ncbi:MAG: hypothetical protein ACE37F_10420 [Nannocystaceae bacterium]|nr:hypothetical protein [bacterium]
MNTTPSASSSSSPSAPSPNAPTEVDLEVQEKYGNRLRARLARPKISIEDARDGMLDCFVSTYFAGVKQGLARVLGVDASPDQVARVAARMFRDRLGAHGVSFDEPTAEALNAVKEEVDVEFHFRELPAELSAMHDQVCSLLLAKADGLLEHEGDRSVVKPKSNGRPFASAPVVRPPSFGKPPSTKGGTRHVATVPPPQPPRRVNSPVTDSLRQALASYLDEVRSSAATAEPHDLLASLDRARGLAQAIADFSR